MSVPVQVTEQFLRAVEDGRKLCRRKKHPPAKRGWGQEVLVPRPAPLAAGQGSSPPHRWLPGWETGLTVFICVISFERSLED